jgi:uncharacterized protein
MISIEFILALLLLGVVVGFFAGLFGIGGGGIMVPILTNLFLWQSVPLEQVVHLALGTSMACIIMTAIASLRAHHARGGVRWPIVRLMTPGVLLGTFVGAFLASILSTQYLAIFFTLFMAFIALQMFRSEPGQSRHADINGLGIHGVSLSIGSLSALVAIGGGSLTVPYLLWRHIDIKTAIGTSAAVGLPIALAGSSGYLVAGWGVAIEQEWVLGYIYLPAVIAISIVSSLTAPLGARAAHALPTGLLKKLFGVCMLVLSLQMLISVM